MKGNGFVAEKYGEIPKLFTKKWWEYFWDYYKWHTIVVVFVLFVAITVIVQVSTSPKYDFNIFYTADFYMQEQGKETLRRELSKFVTDSDGDGKDGVAINEIVFVEGQEDAQVEYAKVTKISLEFTDKNTILYIFDDSKAPYFFDSESMDGIFLETDEWLDEPIEQERLYTKDSKNYAVSLKNSKLFNEYGVDCDNLYVAVRRYYEELDDEMQEKIADAKKIANAIVK